MASRKLTQREKRAKKSKESEEKKILSEKQYAKFVCEKIRDAIYLVEIATGEVQHLKVGDERVEMELKFYNNENLLPMFDDGYDASCAYDRFFIVHNKFVSFTEDKDTQEFGECYITREGVRLDIIAGELFAEKYTSYKWEDFGYSNRRSSIWDENFEPIGKFTAIDALSCISNHEMFTAFCDWCRDNKFNLSDDLINSGKEWKKKM